MGLRQSHLITDLITFYLTSQSMKIKSRSLAQLSFNFSNYRLISIHFTISTIWHWLAGQLKLYFMSQLKITDFKQVNVT